MQHNQSWFTNTWINHQNTVFHDLWQKEFRMRPVTFEYPWTWLHKTKKMWHKSQKRNCCWKTTGCKHHRDYQQEFLIGQFLKYLELENQTFQLFTRTEACSFGQLSLLKTFLVLKVPFPQVTLFVLTKKNSWEEQA